MREDFSGKTHRFPSIHEDGWSAEANGGVYRVTVRDTTRSSSWAGWDHRLSDVRMTADMRFVSGAEDARMGLALQTPDRTHMYILDMSSSGAWSILKVRSQPLIAIPVADGTADPIRPGRTVHVTLEAESAAGATSLTAELDHVTLSSVADAYGWSGFTYGGLSFSTDSPPTVYEVDNVEVTDATTLPSELPSPLSSADQARQATLESVGLRQGELPAGYTLQLRYRGDQVAGRVTLELCGAAFPSEGLRVARRQTDVVGPGMVDVMSVEAVLYESPDATAAALRELREAQDGCSSAFEPSRIPGVPPLRTVFRPAIDRTWPRVTGVQRLTFDAVQSDEAGHSSHAVWVYLVRGDLLVGLYFFHPDDPLPAVAGQTTFQGITGVLETRLAQMPVHP